MEDFEDPEYATINDELVPCSICDRTFFSSKLKKHMIICQKSAAKKRKVFDSSRQRAEGTEISTLKPIKPKSQSAARTTKSDKPEPPKKQSNWRRKHEDFIATIRAAKGITQVIKDGGPLPPPPPPSYDPDYIQCPYCQRRFSESAADRHIKFCKEQAARISNKAKLPAGDAKAKTPARGQFKPPPVKKANSTASTLPVNSRLPQRSMSGPTSGTGIPATKAASAGSLRTVGSGYGQGRPGGSGLTSPPSGMMKPKSSGSAGLVRSSPSGMAMRKTYNSEYNNMRDDVKSAGEVDGAAGQKTKFCHECGTKFPVESAKFCCECGVKRMWL